MSRMIDRLRECDWGDERDGRILGQLCSEEARKNPIIVGDACVEYCFTRFLPMAAGIDLPASIPNAAPPFPMFWIESKLPPKLTGHFTYTDTGKQEVKVIKLPNCIGAFVWGFSAEEIDEGDANGKNKNAPHLTRARAKFPDAKWIVEFIIINEHHKFEAHPSAHLGVAVDQHGHVLGWEEDAGERRKLEFWLTLLLMPITFMHCKNVKQIEVEPSRKLNKARIRRGKLPLLKYHTLEISGMSRILDNEGGAAKTGILQALHICRGHFKTFTADKPLLGKHVGTYFWQDHVRGKGSEGVVAKDYAPVAEGAKSEPEPASDRHWKQAAALAGAVRGGDSQ